MRLSTLLYTAFAHAVASGIVIALALGLTFVSYLGLLVWAILAGAPIGGPLALPGMMLVALVVATVAVAGVLLPVTVSTEILCRGR